MVMTALVNAYWGAGARAEVEAAVPGSRVVTVSASVTDNDAVKQAFDNIIKQERAYSCIHGLCRARWAGVGRSRVAAVFTLADQIDVLICSAGMSGEVTRASLCAVAVTN